MPVKIPAPSSEQRCGRRSLRSSGRSGANNGLFSKLPELTSWVSHVYGSAPDPNTLVSSPNFAASCETGAPRTDHLGWSDGMLRTGARPAACARWQGVRSAGCSIVAHSGWMPTSCGAGLGRPQRATSPEI